jgi:hypothetical protein
VPWISCERASKKEAKLRRQKEEKEKKKENCKKLERKFLDQLV